jgi:hypothetical protein
MTGWGWVKSYKGEKTRTKVLEANIKTRVQGRYSRTRFTVLEETGEDLLVLGDPWLAEHNPDIDWKKRTLKFRKRPERDEGSRAPRLRVVDSRTFEHMEAPWKKYDKETFTVRKGEINKLETIHEDVKSENIAESNELSGNNEIKELEATSHQRHSKAYLAELEDIRRKLPDEVKEFADVFSSEE